MEVRFHYVQQRMQDKTLDLQWISTKQNVADVFTKGLTRHKFQDALKLLPLADLRGRVVHWNDSEELSGDLNRVERWASAAQG